jgi:hypothetical protein
MTLLRQLAQRAGVWTLDGSGCPRCRPLPLQLVSVLAEAIETGAQR